MAAPAANRSADDGNSDRKTHCRMHSFVTFAGKSSMMSLFDNSENIMFIGSDSAEIWKGWEQVRGHLNSIFPDESVSLVPRTAFPGSWSKSQANGNGDYSTVRIREGNESY